MDRNDKEKILHHDDNPGVADHVGEAAGGVSGVVTGAAIGSAAGPIGTIIGGIAGAVGGWWAGRSVAEAATAFGKDDDVHYRTAYEAHPNRLGDRSYEDIRPAYQLGHLAGSNPDYQGRNFDAVETDLQRGWTDDLRSRHGDWSSVRPFAREAYERRTVSATGRDAAARVGNSAENLADRTGDALKSGANRVVDAVDNVKDRVDGNPASKPGPDATDRRF